MTTKDAADEAIIKQISDLALVATLFGYEDDARAAFDKAANFAKMFGPKPKPAGPAEQAAKAPTMEAWIDGRPPYDFSGEIEVKMRSMMAVRTIRYKPEYLALPYRFTDCENPAQNAICDHDDIVAWRPKK